MTVTAVVQARLSSKRFPGKVLAPFRGKPILEHVLAAVERVVDPARAILATSIDPSDDRLADFARARGTRVVRGSLDNVLARIQQAASASDSDWILRISADSPMLDPLVLERVIRAAADDGCDLVTTIYPRTFPKGRNAELIRTAALLQVDAAAATPEEQEHVTQYFYARPQQFRIRNVESGNPELAQTSLAVDTEQDLRRLERMTDDDLARLAAPAASR